MSLAYAVLAALNTICLFSNEKCSYELKLQTGQSQVPMEFLFDNEIQFAAGGTDVIWSAYPICSNKEMLATETLHEITDTMYVGACSNLTPEEEQKELEQIKESQDLFVISQGNSNLNYPFPQEEIRRVKFLEKEEENLVKKPLVSPISHTDSRNEFEDSLHRFCEVNRISDSNTELETIVTFKSKKIDVSQIKLKEPFVRIIPQKTKISQRAHIFLPEAYVVLELHPGLEPYVKAIAFNILLSSKISLDSRNVIIHTMESNQLEGGKRTTVHTDHFTCNRNSISNNEVLTALIRSYSIFFTTINLYRVLKNLHRRRQVERNYRNALRG